MGTLPIHSLASDKGPDLCKVLPAVHSLTGCDYTSKVGTKQAAFKANPVNYLRGFGCSQNVPSVDEVERAESYLVKVLKNGTTCTTVDEPRDHYYYRIIMITREIAIYKPYDKGPYSKGILRYICDDINSLCNYD